MAPAQLDSSLLRSLLLVVSCFAIVRSLWSRRKQGGRAAPPPSPPAWPVIGNILQLGQGHHHRKLQSLARRHGPLFLCLGSVPTVVVSSASVAEAVLKTQDHVFCGRPQQHTARGVLYGCQDIGFSPYGERWRQLRRIAVVHLLSAKRVDSFRALREEEVASLVARIRAAIEWAMAELIKNQRKWRRYKPRCRGGTRTSPRGAAGEDEPPPGSHEGSDAATSTVQDTDLHNYDIPAKTRLIINAWEIGRDGESWENPEDFLPDRFVHSDIGYSGKDFRFIPFSAGRRGCPSIAFAFATRLVELVLANLMCHFDWELPEGQELESFEVVESSGLSPGLKSALILVAKPLQALTAYGDCNKVLM
ncbi:Cytochrome P450 71A1 [Dichanthelium oligosanthes]|uniref:Cytochrome P450 71A1 n=1 Tax=Dichanthelium oligosanthes TaxID=888268 RepID=A0A1E5VHN8_9POAL|nr:Cytochrome P450 71A1 [Dichanthelium oligosanthes]